MEYRKLGNSNILVSSISLGCNLNFGRYLDESQSIDLIRYAHELGINLIDTTAVSNGGRSEEILGKAIQGLRSEFIIATKFTPRMEPGERASSRAKIRQAVESSLRRLETDYIDLYFIHTPDPSTPSEEIMESFDSLVKSGKVRFIGCSNYSAWQLSEAICVAKINNQSSFVAVQSQYNLLNQAIEPELVPCCKHFDVGIIAYQPLAEGFLTGKYQRGAPVLQGTRLSDPQLDRPSHMRSQKILSDRNFNKLEKLQNSAGLQGFRPGELAIAWLLYHTWLSSIVTSVRTREQLADNVSASNRRLTPEEFEQVNNI